MHVPPCHVFVRLRENGWSTQTNFIANFAAIVVVVVKHLSASPSEQLVLTLILLLLLLLLLCSPCHTPNERNNTNNKCFCSIHGSSHIVIDPSAHRHYVGWAEHYCFSKNSIRSSRSLCANFFYLFRSFCLLHNFFFLSFLKRYQKARNGIKIWRNAVRSIDLVLLVLLLLFLFLLHHIKCILFCSVFPFLCLVVVVVARAKHTEKHVIRISALSSYVYMRLGALHCIEPLKAKKKKNA